MTDAIADVWRQIIIGDHKSWVLFANGTCVILMEPGSDLAEQATAILSEYGPVRVASPAGDFSTITLDAQPGWVVTGHHPDVLTYVSPAEVTEPDDLTVGLFGRSKRDRDGREPQIIYVEDRRSVQE